MRKAGIFGSLLAFALMGAGAPGQAQEEEFVFDNAQNMKGWSSGPEVGERIPDITGLDQHGNPVAFKDIKGPNGAYILFHRSADW